MSKVQQLRDELQRRDDLLDLINKYRPPCKPLHPIALRMVFEALVTPSDFLDASLSAGSQSPWCQTLRMKKGLCLVSRAWREAAVPLLYGEVTLRRAGQLIALVRTLQENPEAYTYVIRSVTLSFHIPEGYKRLVEQNLAYILIVCPHIRSLSFASAFADWLPSDPLFATKPTANPLVVVLRQVGSRITNFEYFDGELSAAKGRYTLPTQLIKTFTGIVSLTLLLPPSTLERLENLTLWHRDADNGLLAMTERWTMPRLRSVAFRALCCDYNVKTRHYSKFFEKFGRGLTYLDFGPYKLHKDGPGVATERISAALKHCPSLQHLVVIDTCLSEQMEALISDSTLFHIDVWLRYPIAPLLSEGDVARLLSSSDARFFRPGVRLLDRSLSHIPDLPRLLPPIPDQPQDDPPLIHRMTGFSVVETKWCIFRQTADWNDAWDGFPDTLFEMMGPFWEPDNQGEPDSETDSGQSKDDIDSDVCSHHSCCRYKSPSAGDGSGSSSYFDSDEVDDQDQFRYLEGWQAEDDAPEVPPEEPESVVQLTEGDVLDIFTTQVEFDPIRTLIFQRNTRGIL